MILVISSGITLTKAEALRIQAEQVKHYAAIHGDDVRQVVAAATTADELGDGEYDMITINCHIPRGEAIEWLIAAARKQAAEAEASAKPARQIVRVFSPCGPCLTEGELIRTTDKFYIYREWKGGDRFEGEKRISRTKAHIEPCHCCTDHPQTHYRNGHMD